MNREIKFRGKRIDNGEWEYGHYVVLREGHMIVNTDGAGLYFYNQVDPATVGQFTGLKDKNGREIYEGNIAKVTQKNNGFYMLCKIEYEPMSFILKFKNGVKSVYKEGLDEEDFELEIIGDIHENPELLET